MGIIGLVNIAIYTKGIIKPQKTTKKNRYPYAHSNLPNEKVTSLVSRRYLIFLGLPMYSHCGYKKTLTSALIDLHFHIVDSDFSQTPTNKVDTSSFLKIDDR